MSEPTTPQQQLDTVIESGDFQGYKNELEDFQKLNRDGKEQRLKKLKLEIDTIIGRFNDPHLHTLRGLLNNNREEFEDIVKRGIQSIEDMSGSGRYEIVMKSIIAGGSKIDDLKKELLANNFGLSRDEIQRLILYPLFNDRGIFEIFDSAEEALIVTIATATPCIGLAPPWGPYIFAGIAGAAGAVYAGWKVGKGITSVGKALFGKKEGGASDLRGEAPKKKLELSEEELAKATEDAKKAARKYMVEHPDLLEKMKIKLENGAFRKLKPLNPEPVNPKPVNPNEATLKAMEERMRKLRSMGGKRRTRKAKKSKKRGTKKAKKSAKRKSRKSRR